MPDQEDESPEASSEALTPLSVVVMLRKQFEESAKAQLAMAEAFRVNTEAIQRRDRKLWWVIGMAALALIASGVDIWQTWRLGDIERLASQVSTNTGNITDLTTNINDFVEELQSQENPEPINRAYIEDFLVPLIAEATVAAIEAREGVPQGG